MPKIRTPAQQAMLEKIQARMGKKVSSTARAVTPAKAISSSSRKSSSSKKKRSATPKLADKKKKASLSSAKTTAERLSIINARLGKTGSPGNSKPEKGSEKKTKKKVKRRTASKKVAQKKVYENPEDSEEEEVHVNGNLDDSDGEEQVHRLYDSATEDSDAEIVEKTTTTTTTTIRKSKAGATYKKRSRSTSKTGSDNGNSLFNLNLLLIVVIVACAFYFCMPIIRANLLLPPTDDYKVLNLKKIDVDANPKLLMTAYRRRAKELHPDSGSGDEKAFVQVVEAYQHLKQTYSEKIKAMKNNKGPNNAQVSTIAYTPVSNEVQVIVNAIKRRQDITNIGIGAALGFCIAVGVASMG